MWPKLCKPEEYQAAYKGMQQQLKWVEKHVEEGCAVLPLMEAHVLHSACDDPGAVILSHLILPLLQRCLEDKAKESQVFNQPNKPYWCHFVSIVCMLIDYVASLPDVFIGGAASCLVSSALWTASPLVRVLCTARLLMPAMPKAKQG